jgi:hypothetical protein
MVILLVTALISAGPTGTAALTEHYHVRAAGSDAEEVGRMLESLHAELTRWFGASPQGRLDLEIFADREDYRQAILDDRQPFVQGGGYYAPDTRKVYLFRQPSVYFTRQLILHEATHQFHLLAATRNRLPKTAWYLEGLAEFFGMHRWDGSNLECGVVPAVSLEDYPARAREAFDACGGDLAGIIGGGTPASRPLAWSLLHFLMHRDPRRFKALGRRLDRDEDPLSAWDAVFGPVTPELVADYRRWVADHQQPWSVVWTSWQAWGEAIEGDSRVVGITVLKDTPDRLEAAMELVEGNLKAGLVFGYRSPDDFHLLEVLPGGRAWIVHRSNGGWTTLVSDTLPLAEGRPVVALRRQHERVALLVNGREFHTLEAPGQVGLSVDGCRVRFDGTPVRGED